MSGWIDVCAVSEIPPGGRRTVDVDGAEALVVNVAGELMAVEDVCTHDGTPIAEGEIEDGVIICPRHGARFCLRTGEALCAPAYDPIATFEVRVHNDRVQVRDSRFD